MGLLSFTLPTDASGNIVGVTPTQRGAVTTRVFSGESPSALERVANRFGVQVLPHNATQGEHAFWMLHWRTMALGQVLLMRNMYDIRPGFSTDRAAAKVQRWAQEHAGEWDSVTDWALAPLTFLKDLSWGGVRALISYAFDAIETGWGAHIGDNPQRLIEAGVMTADELERDYLLRLASYQAMFELLTNESTRFLMIREQPASGLGAAPAAAGGAVVIGGLAISYPVAITIAVVVVIGVCLLIASLYQINRGNELLDKARQGCMIQFQQYGKESQFCQDLPQQFGAAATKTPLDKFTEDLTTYLLIGGAGVLAIMFLPEITRSIREARREARPQEVRLAQNRRRRRRR